MEKIIITGPECVGKSRLCKEMIRCKDYIISIPYKNNWLKDFIEEVNRKHFTYIVIEDVFLCSHINYSELLSLLEGSPITKGTTLIIVSREMPSCNELLNDALIISLKRNSRSK